MKKHGDGVELHVYLDSELTNGPVLLGSLFSQKEHVWFRYDSEWIKHAQAFALDPDLHLGEGDFHPNPARSNFGVFLDSSPDRWGQMLMTRREQIAARDEQRRARTLFAWDFLVGVQDRTRMGAVRFRLPESEHFLDNHPLPAPPITELRALEGIAANVASKKSLDDLGQLGRWLAALVAPGASLGGARPKASFTDSDGSLWIAKFPSRDDERDHGLWEMLLHELAQESRIIVPPAKLMRFASPFHTFCVKRFDRSGDKRLYMRSAMTALQKTDGEEGSYLELLEFIRTRGAAGVIEQDQTQLFRRMVFNVMVGNRDDHLRNHAFMLGAEGWRLSPAYDMTPGFEKETHVLTLDGTSAAPSVATVIGTAEFFELTPVEAGHIVDEIYGVVSQWRERAKEMGISRGDIELTSTAFDATDDYRPHMIGGKRSH